MSLLHNIQHTERINSAKNPIWMDVLRFALGIFLFMKGILFLENTTDMLALLSLQQDYIELRQANLFFSSIHIVGGLMIAFGFLTRLALLCQIPILIGAALVVNPRQGIYLENTELWISLLVLALLIFFMIVGPGRFSIDNLILRDRTRAE